MLGHVPIHPLEDEVSNPKIVLVLHQHVAVTADAQRRQVKHPRVSACGVDALYEGHTTLEGGPPGEPWNAGRGIEVVAEHNEGRYLRERCDLLVGLPCRCAATRLHQ